MRNAIAVLRYTADDCERTARRAKDALIKADLFDITAHWRYLAGEAEKLYEREKQLEAAADLCAKEGPSEAPAFIWNGP
jgi:hypothetical protein